ncbi:MAG: DUF3800 domain-containing protein [Gammaproteobacteria bacterium]
MPQTFNFYMDDSGTRRPNRRPLRFDAEHPEFFAMGGILIADEDEDAARDAHAKLYERWGLTYPLHSVDIRNSTENFTWLCRDTRDYKRFMVELTRFLTRIPVLGLACVIDRPGYDARYREKYGRRAWHLCQTAFAIAVERAAKHALVAGRKLRVFPERCSRKDDARLETYYRSMRAEGLPFDRNSSQKYEPLSQNELNSVLYELRFKKKSSPLTQVADLYLWPIAQSGYRPDNRPYVTLRNAGRVIDQAIPAEQVPERGIKFSCFELVHCAR